MDSLKDIAVKEGLENPIEIIQQFIEFELTVQEYATKALAIVVTDETQTELMADAREARLFLKGERVKMQKVHKALKVDIIKKGNTIDGIANHLKSLFVPAEKHLLAQENFIEIREAERLDVLYQERSGLLHELGVVFSLFDLRGMTQEVFDKLVADTKETNRLKQDEADRIEAERVATETAQAAETERLRLENIRLQTEATAQAEELSDLQKAKTVSDEKTEQAETVQKDVALSLYQQNQYVRRVLTKIQTSTKDDCDSCMTIRAMCTTAFQKLSGCLEDKTD